MMFREAAEIAKAGGAGRLVLTHFSTSLEAPEEALSAAADVFADTVIGRDGMILRLSYPKDTEGAGLEIHCKEDW